MKIHKLNSNRNYRKDETKFFGNYLGVVISNDDPDKAGKIKVWVPHISPSLYEEWDKIKDNKSFNFIGRNIDSDITDIVDKLKRILPWSTPVSPIVGGNSVGVYNSYLQQGSVSDSNNLQHKEDNNHKPGHFVTVDDAFVDNTKIPFNQSNKYGKSIKPKTYSNSAKGLFGIPNVGAHVWVFFEDGDPNSPLYFACNYGSQAWQSVYSDLDYPDTYENKNKSERDFDHNTETYRNKFILNQKGGTLEIVSTDNRELLRITHFSGSFKEMANEVTREFASNDDVKLVIGDSFYTTKQNRNEYTGKDYDNIINGDYYVKIGDFNQELHKQYKQILSEIADAKQLFETKRAKKIEFDGYIKLTSSIQEQSGKFDLCPLCSSPYREKHWDTLYTLTSLDTTPITINSDFTGFDFSNVVGSNESVKPRFIQPESNPPKFLNKGPCPVCNGTGISPSTFRGLWKTNDKDILIPRLYQSKINELTQLERKLGVGGSQIIQISKNKIENIGLVTNDLPSIRVDLQGKIQKNEIIVFPQGVVGSYGVVPLIEQVHVDDLPGGDYYLNVANKFVLKTGSGGINLKTQGNVDVSGAITNVAGSQVNIGAEYDVNICSKKIDIVADILTIRNKNKKQVVIDSNLGIAQNLVVAGSAHIEGELSVQHVTAPLEVQETEAVILYGELVAGKQVTNGEGVAIATKNSVMIYAHSHQFKNLPLKLMKSRDDVRKVGEKTSNTSPSPALPVTNEYKRPERGDKDLN